MKLNLNLLLNFYTYTTIPFLYMIKHKYSNYIDFLFRFFCLRKESRNKK